MPAGGGGIPTEEYSSYKLLYSINYNYAWQLCTAAGRLHNTIVNYITGVIYVGRDSHKITVHCKFHPSSSEAVQTQEQQSSLVEWEMGTRKEFVR